MKIRIATKNDYKSVNELHLKLHDFHRKEEPELFEDIVVFYTKAEYNRRLKKGFVYFIAKIDEKDIGIISISLHKGDFYTNISINSFFVEEEYRKNGAGRKLFDYAMEYIKTNYNTKKYSNYIDLCVYDFNKNAINFYKNAGFKNSFHGMCVKFKEG